MQGATSGGEIFDDTVYVSGVKVLGFLLVHTITGLLEDSCIHSRLIDNA